MKKKNRRTIGQTEDMIELVVGYNEEEEEWMTPRWNNKEEEDSGILSALTKKSSLNICFEVDFKM
jgi:hypothetical protein